MTRSTSIQRRDFLKTSAAAAGAIGLAVSFPATAQAQSPDSGTITLSDAFTKLAWRRDGRSWTLAKVAVRGHSGWRAVAAPSGLHSLWYVPDGGAPSADEIHRVTAGRHLDFLPSRASHSRQTVTLAADTEVGTLTSTWWISEGCILVKLSLKASKAGWYGLPTPALATIKDPDMAWGVIPGYWNASTIEKDDELSYHYQFGVPAVPEVTTEVTTTSLMAIIQNKRDGMSLAAIAQPSLARDPWASDSSTLKDWHVGASLRALSGPLSPTIVYPIPGQDGSHLQAGQTVTASYRYIVRQGSWQQIPPKVMSDPYGLHRYLRLAHAEDSLSHRINRMHDFIVLPDSKWHTWDYQGLTLGAESGKPSDVGAMWMMAELTGDPIIIHDRLPYVRNYKLAQQDTGSGAFGGAALGEYFKDDAFVSEIVWAARSGADYVSPIFTTFYTLADGGNIALFNPDDAELKRRLRLAADKLLEWQHSDGSFDVGYVRSAPTKLRYPELKDYRTTWYGFLCAYRVLGDHKYLQAARRGADWFCANAVSTGNYLGVCDDTHLVTDFSVIFAAQALLDLYNLTHEPRYRMAAIEAAHVYMLHIYDHPVPTTKTKDFHGTEMSDWKTSQVGLNFEHAGYDGSAKGNGPILLASHAGAFVRFYEITGEKIFLDLARAAARGRDAFVDPESGIPSYYWNTGNTGARWFPWHIWWHIGWVTDYLIQEAHLRSRGRIAFPGGFCTSKVGSHKPYGFQPGTIYGQKADLFAPRQLITMDQPDVDWLAARSTDSKRLFVIALNQTDKPLTGTLTLDPRTVQPGKVATWNSGHTLAGRAHSAGTDKWKLSIDSEGITVLTVDFTLADDPNGPKLRNFTISGDYLTPTIAWSYFATVTSRAQWRIGNEDSWHSTTTQEGHTFSTQLDLKDIATPATVQVRVSTTLPDGTTGYSEPARWTIPKQYDPAGPNLALHQQTDVSSVYDPKYPGSMAVDGNTTDTASRWISAEHDVTPTIAIHLAGGPTTPKLVRVVSGPDDKQRLVNFDVQTRQDDAAWETVGTVSGNTLQTLGIALKEKTADQLRLRITNRSRDSVDVARVFEVEIYDKVK